MPTDTQGEAMGLSDPTAEGGAWQEAQASTAALRGAPARAWNTWKKARESGPRAEPGLQVVSCSGLQINKLLMKESTWIEIVRDL